MTDRFPSSPLIDRRLLLGGLGASAALAAAPLKAGAAASAPIVETGSGRVRGVERDGVAIFRGIPYGADTARTRFQRSEPATPWAGVRDAVAYGAQCPQVGIYLTGIYESQQSVPRSSEDCLFVNVWTPAAGAGKRPVMVWLHGGGFESGSGSSIWYDGTNLCRRGDIVVVTLNHRLNAFGFAYLGYADPRFADSGNVGLLDIVDALTWVRDNIASFGGDPGNVTIFGESGGGLKVSTLAAMPAAKGLFHKSICQSGSTLKVRDRQQAAQNGQRLLDALELRAGDERLLTVSTDRLLAAGLAASKVTAATLVGPTNFIPVVDGRALPNHPFDTSAPAVSRDVPMIAGWTRTETSRLIGARDQATLALDNAGLLAKLKQYVPEADPAPLVAEFRAAHPAAGPSEIFFLITTAIGLRGEALQLAGLKAKGGGAPVWTYELAWHTPVEGGRWFSPHALDIPFVFDTTTLAPSLVGPVTAETRAVTDAMTAAWLAFAHTGNPATRTRDWPAYAGDGGTVMVFDTVSHAVPNAFAQERAATAAIPVQRIIK